MPRAALYARYSSDRQSERSVVDQLDLCRRHAAERGWLVVAEFSDAAISGAAMANRPGLQALLAAAAAGDFDILVVEDTDRLARNREHDAHVYNRLTYAGVTIATPSTDKVTVIESALKGLMNELYLVQLADKTRRGMRANAELGLATGSRLYGYRSEPKGAVTIVEAEAEVVRGIFRAYAAGATARDIAGALNADGKPGPRGGLWNASTINGSRARANGVLGTELYAGVKIWNRMLVRKDPDTGRRRPQMKPQSAWRRTPAPALRIVEQALWDQVQARRAGHAALSAALQGAVRKPGIFTGLIRCGFCGAGYTALGRGRLSCAAHREKGDTACANSRTVMRAEVERRVLEALRTRLLDPEAAAAFVRAYHAEIARLGAERREARAPLERRIAELRRAEERTIDAIEQGRATDAMADRMMAHNAERLRLQAELVQLVAAAGGLATAPIALHPGAPARYRAIVEGLQLHMAELSADPNGTPQAREAVATVRELVTRIDVTPATPEPGGRVDITLVGNLALLLSPPGDLSTAVGRAVVAGDGYSAAPNQAWALSA